MRSLSRVLPEVKAASISSHRCRTCMLTRDGGSLLQGTAPACVRESHGDGKQEGLIECFILKSSETWRFHNYCVRYKMTSCRRCFAQYCEGRPKSSLVLQFVRNTWHQHPRMTPGDKVFPGSIKTSDNPEKLQEG